MNNLRHPGARGWPVPGWRALGVIIPILLASPRLADEGVSPPGRRGEVPPPNAVNVWLDDSEGLDFDVAGLRQAGREELGRSPVLHPQLAARTIGSFTQVGSVAVLEGDDATVTRMGTGFGVDARNLAWVSNRFIQAFGDDYDQIAVFL